MDMNKELGKARKLNIEVDEISEYVIFDYLSNKSGYRVGWQRRYWGKETMCYLISCGSFSYNLYILDKTNKITDLGQYLSSRYGVQNLRVFGGSGLTSMKELFKGCNSLIHLNLSHMDTSNVTGMEGLFDGCESLTQIIFKSQQMNRDQFKSTFNTANVTDMSHMFNDCKSLTGVDLSCFNTTKTVSMAYMFQGCKQLKRLDFPSMFDTSNVVNMQGMFKNCESLESLDLHTFETEQVEKLRDMFCRCKSIQTLNIHHFRFKRGAQLSGIFNECYSLELVDIAEGSWKQALDILNSSSPYYNNFGVINRGMLRIMH